MTGLSIPTRPRFPKYFSVEIVEGQGAVLYGERAFRILTGRLNERLATVLDGKRTADEVVDELADEFPPEDVYYALFALARDELLLENEESLGSRPSVAEGEHGEAFRDIVGQRSNGPVSVHAVQLEVAQAWSSALQSHGFRVEKEGDVALVIASDYLDPGLAPFNQTALARAKPWMLCRARGPLVWIGPLFVPGESACWECLRHRLYHSHPVRAFLAKRARGAPLAPPSAASFTHLTAVGLIAGQLAQAVGSSERGKLAGVLAQFDTLTLTLTRHRVARRPQCPACGDPEMMTRLSSAGFTLQAQPKGFTADGGHRTITPEETVTRLLPLVDPLTGVVGELRRLPYDNPAIHVYTSGLNGATAHRDLTGLNAGLRRSSSGKGFTEAQARASALGEAIERYSAMHQGDEPRRRASFRELGDLAVHPAKVLQYSDAQYASASRHVNAEDWVPERFDEEARIEWSPIWSMTQERTRYLPTALLYFGYESRDRVFGLADSNGNAAGNTREEAILQGLFELVERDSTAMWWYNRARRPQVDIDSLQLDGWPDIRRYYESLDREIWLLDATSDIGIPVFVCVSRQRAGGRQDVLLGLGSHCDPRIAGSRAISEMNQMLAALGSLREGVGVNHTLARWLGEATVENQPYLLPAPGAVARGEDFRLTNHDDLLDDVRWCQRRIEALGMEMLVLDQTRPDVELPVVKVVVPELRHFRPRFAPGRLFEVPVALGWVARPTSESDLNPIPFFL